MGVLRSSVSFEAEVEELRKVLRIDHLHKGRRRLQKEQKQHGHGYDINENRRVCVTSGISFLGFAIVNRLLTCGYNVRLLLDTQEDLEKVREMEMIDHIHEEEEADDDDDDDERRRRNGGSVGAVVVGDMMDVNSLCEAFNGCSCVFHTSAFTDSTGVSGYSKHMAEIEARSAERVIEACVRTQSVRKCVFTSSLLACIWRGDYSPHNHRLPTIVDENCWSDETLCRDRKLWFALGKTMAEKAAWRAARGRDLRLVTLCPGLVTGPGFRRRNSTPSIAYLKGAQEMLTDGLLATVDISKLAEAHVGIYEAMGTASAAAACGRYICFGHVIRRVEEVTELERQLGITPSRISANVAAAAGESPPTNWFELSNRKLSRLMSPTNRRCSYDIYSILYT